MFKTSAELSQEAYKYYGDSRPAVITNQTAFELLFFITELIEKRPGIIDIFQRHPAQPSMWMRDLQQAVKDNEDVLRP